MIIVMPQTYSKKKLPYYPNNFPNNFPVDPDVTKQYTFQVPEE